MRGQNLRLDRYRAVARGFRELMSIPIPPKGAPPDAGNRPINYRLEEKNGGSDPGADDCCDWSYGERTPTADCIGFVLYCSGIDRKQPGYKGTRGEWLNCASLMDDAKGAQTYCRTLRDGEREMPGDWLLTRDHIGLIVRRATDDSEILVLDCSPRHGRKHAIGLGGPWSDACTVIRPKIYAEAP